MNKSFFLISFILFSFAFLSCGAIKPGMKKDSKKDPRTGAEESFDPWDLDQEDPLITQNLVVERSEGRDFGFPQSFTEEDSEIGFKTLYRVQVFATKFPQQAYRIADSLKVNFEENIYVDYQSPYYKVRLGDFDREEDAQRFLIQVRSKGYSESWVVKVNARVEDVKD